MIVSTAAAGDPWSLALTYATDLFTEPTAATMLRRFVALLEVLTADPGLPVGEAGIVDAAERSAVLAASQGSAQPVPPGTRRRCDRGSRRQLPGQSGAAPRLPYGDPR